MFEIGQKLTKENYTAAAIWCNRNGAHIEQTQGEFIIAANAPVTPDVQMQLLVLERQSGLSRAVRELVLAENSGVSGYVRQKAQAIETLARELRHECGNV